MYNFNYMLVVIDFLKTYFNSLVRNVNTILEKMLYSHRLYAQHMLFSAITLLIHAQYSKI